MRVSAVHTVAQPIERKGRLATIDGIIGLEVFPRLAVPTPPPIRAITTAACYFLVWGVSGLSTHSLKPSLFSCLAPQPPAGEQSARNLEFSQQVHTVNQCTRLHRTTGNRVGGPTERIDLR